VRRALAEGAVARERIRLQAELEASQAAMRGSLDAMSDPFLICSAERDAAGTIVDFRVAFANRAAAAFMHRAQDTVIGASIPRQMLYLRGVRFFDAFREVTETGQGWTEDGVEYTVPGPDGDTLHGLVNIQIAPFGDGFFAVWRDVTESERVSREREQLAVALEQTSDGMVIVSRDGIVTFANPAFLSGRGLALEDVLGRDARAIAGALFGPAVSADLLTAIPSDAGWSRDVEYVGPDGATRRIEVTSTPLLDADSKVTSYIAMSRDITEREQARMALEASEQHLRTALDTMLDGVAIYRAVRDGQGRIVDFLIEYANSAIGTLGGPTGSLQMGRSLHEMFPANWANGLFDEYVRVVETGVPLAADDVPFVDPNAAGGPLDQRLDVRAAKLGDGLVISIRDASVRHGAELELRRLATAVEQSAEAVVITDAAGVIEYVNSAFERSSGYTRDEVMGKNPRILKSGVQSPAFYAAMWTALTSGSSFVGDLTNKRKDGRLFQEEAVISPIFDETGTTTSYVAVKRDVTRERASEATVQRLARERAQIAEAIADLQVLPSPAETAAEIVRHVVRLAGITTARIAYFTQADPAIPLAFVRADGLSSLLARVPPARGRTLRERAAEGPWVEAWVGHPSHPYDRLFRELGIVAAAHAPIRLGGQVIGLLSVASAEANALDQLTETLPALLEFAGAASGLLGPSIIDLTESGEIRLRIARIIGEAAFQPVFQPIVDIPSGVRVGYEALTRFSNGIRPDLVFAAARAVGLESELEMAALAASIKAAAGLPTDAWLSLNVSPALVTGEGRLARLLRAADRPLVLEVTEHVVVADYEALRTAIHLLRPEVRVAVDDAGSGIANFGHIVELRPAFVKIDIGLVRGIDSDLTRQAMMVGLLHFATASASRTIAEGVETELELATLRALGVPLAQGYLLGRPAPVDAWAEPGAVDVEGATPDPAAARR
ncbi:MAG TPA: EAL domain-containing protein, partial [Candidatus Limnocylindrales bacterium]